MMGAIPGMSGQVTAELDRRLLVAHRQGDLGAMAEIYRLAAEDAETAGDRDRAAFLFTHAWIFALEAGDDMADVIGKRLRAQGRA